MFDLLTRVSSLATPFARSSFEDCSRAISDGIDQTGGKSNGNVKKIQAVFFKTLKLTLPPTRRFGVKCRPSNPAPTWPLPRPIGLYAMHFDRDAELVLKVDAAKSLRASTRTQFFAESPSGELLMLRAACCTAHTI